MRIIYSPKCLEYAFEGHPESPERVSSAIEHLKNRYKIIPPEAAPKEDILTVHTHSLHNMVETGRFHDPDTPNLPEMYRYAALSAGSAIKAASLALKGGAAFSLMRPPGHHAGRDFLGGFCYFNSIAIAAACLQKKNSMKIAILDIDCHHGNGTEDIFLGSKNILYVSLHQEGIYPGTGLISRENCIDFLLKAQTEEKEYLAVLGKALEKIKPFKPEILAVSAGFDTYEFDPLCSLGLRKESYTKIGGMVADLEMPLFCVLEGGYSADLKFLLENFLSGIER